VLDKFILIYTDLSRTAVEETCTKKISGPNFFKPERCFMQLNIGRVKGYLLHIFIDE